MWRKTSWTGAGTAGLLAALALLSGCFGGGRSPGATVASVTVTPQAGAVRISGRLQFIATARDASGRPVAATFAWAVNPSSLGNISSDGLFVPGPTPGEGQVVCQAGGVTATATVEVVPPIAYVNKDNALCLIMPDGTGRRQVYAPPGTLLSEPDWSHDGTRLAFGASQDNGTTWHIWVVSANGAGASLRQLTSGSAKNACPVWSPDGQKMLFMSNADGGDWDIFVMNADGSSPVNLTSGYNGYDGFPDWSPDGQRIVFMSDRADPKRDLFLMNADGSAPAVFEASAGYDEQPSWSPDGQRILFCSTPGAFPYDLWVKSVDGLAKTNLTSGSPASERAPRWSPDGSQIVYADHSSSPARLYRAASDGSAPQLLADDLSGGDRPAWW
ncbi:MAG: hypothetical protein QME79_05350 [Bacillota bacterium]|nr:hypothetical protein [Bacillota bacterium]